jgi:predicted enzyme related to lactoylglutathione lyase
MTPVHHAINYVEITVTDMDTAQLFYAAAFGLRFTDYAPAYAGIRAPLTAPRSSTDQPSWSDYLTILVRESD